MPWTKSFLRTSTTFERCRGSWGHCGLDEIVPLSDISDLSLRFKWNISFPLCITTSRLAYAARDQLERLNLMSVGLIFCNFSDFRIALIVFWVAIDCFHFHNIQLFPLTSTGRCQSLSKGRSQVWNKKLQINFTDLKCLQTQLCGKRTRDLRNKNVIACVRLQSIRLKCP